MKLRTSHCVVERPDQPGSWKFGPFQLFQVEVPEALQFGFGVSFRLDGHDIVFSVYLQGEFDEPEPEDE